MEPYADRRANGGRLMEWGRILAYITVGRHVSLDWRHLRWTQRQVCLDWHTAFSGI